MIKNAEISGLSASQFQQSFSHLCWSVPSFSFLFPQVWFILKKCCCRRVVRSSNCMIAGENNILFLIAEYVVPQCPSGCSKDFKITIEWGCIDGSRDPVVAVPGILHPRGHVVWWPRLVSPLHMALHPSEWFLKNQLDLGYIQLCTYRFLSNSDVRNSWFRILGSLKLLQGILSCYHHLYVKLAEWTVIQSQLGRKQLIPEVEVSTIHAQFFFAGLLAKSMYAPICIWSYPTNFFFQLYSKYLEMI